MPKGSGLYKTVKGKQVEISAREAKQYIMKVNNWTEAQYKKQYDIFKNKLRAKEGFERSKGMDVKVQSASQLLYKEAKAKSKYGKDYKPSLQMQKIRSFTSVSSGKALQKSLKSKKFIEKREAIYKEQTAYAFENFINANPTAQRIVNEITDPVKQAQALSDLAKKVKARENEEGKIQAGEVIPFGESTGGSTEEVGDFDIEAYK